MRSLITLRVMIAGSVGLSMSNHLKYKRTLLGLLLPTYLNIPEPA